MNKEYYRIQSLISEAEKKAVNDVNCLYRNGFHIMPPTGWLNDPNGLCQYNGEYHLFFQYSPLDARGGMKAWGHYVTKDFVNLTYLGAPFVPDEDFDKNGVYSGSSYVDEEGMHIFYTGNVKLDGDHDYTYSGRRADTVLVESKDGRTFTDKKVVIDTDEYPDGYSCHIRDPKVWSENGTYYMVLGARTSKDEGRILLYKSDDMKLWKLAGEIESVNKFGYMWECPDYFGLDGKHIISFSPQGVDAEEYRFQNIYQSGYVIEERNPVKECEKGLPENDSDTMIIDETSFIEWDMGFDFYAPQTFLDESGRRIIVGWAGMPDASYSNGEVEAENWQHCFTVPRELCIKKGTDGKDHVFQIPLSEIMKLSEDVKSAYCMINDGIVSEAGCFKEVSAGPNETSQVKYISEDGLMDIVCEKIRGQFSVYINDGVTFIYDGETCKLMLNDECGRGRKIRKAKLSKLDSLRILVDSSIIEYYINDGEIVFTTRFFKNSKNVDVLFDLSFAKIEVYSMNRTNISF